MGLSNAERQRRYRERKREQQRADQAKGGSTPPLAAAPAVTGNAVTDAPELGSRGLRLWQQVAAEPGELKPSERVLLEEACRVADRLDVIDRILRGDEDAWMRLHSANDDGSIVKVVLNQALAEARQQQIALKTLLAELRQSRSAGGKQPAGGRKAPTAGSGGGGVGGGGITDLTARIARRAQPTG
ncbi:hypothetical protein ACWCHM_26085 [Micromonospora sp. SCSIO 07396]